jgi:hypothetical protein
MSRALFVAQTLRDVEILRMGYRFISLNIRSQKTWKRRRIKSETLAHEKLRLYRQGVQALILLKSSFSILTL